MEAPNASRIFSILNTKLCRDVEEDHWTTSIEFAFPTHASVARKLRKASRGTEISKLHLNSGNMPLRSPPSSRCICERAGSPCLMPVVVSNRGSWCVHDFQRVSDARTVNVYRACSSEYSIVFSKPAYHESRTTIIFLSLLLNARSMG